VNSFNNREVLRAIIKGDINSLREYFSSGLSSGSLTEKEGWNLLHQATILVGKPANVNSVEFLLKNGVSANVQDMYGNIPLHYSARNNDIATVQLLIDFNSEVNVLNHDGVSPLHQALLNANINIELVQLLLSHGASTKLGGVTEFSKSINNSAVNEVFRQYGIKA